VRESVGEIAELEVGIQGRILARGGQPFSYDPVGRRTEDDRFVYTWDWRGQLQSVTVKNWDTPFAGHEVKYRYDATGRLIERRHLGPSPDRLLQELRVYVWENEGLAIEAGYADEAQSQLRYKKTYVPGPGGYDDALQVLVETPGLSPKLYTILRDELGSVLGLIAESEGSDPTAPPIPARYHYTPYGEAHVELGPELRQARFEPDITTAGGNGQTISSELTHAAGAMSLSFALALDPVTVGTGVEVEQQSGPGWQSVAAHIAADAGESTQLHVVATAGWERGQRYRVRLETSLRDRLNRQLPEELLVEWQIPTTGNVAYEQRFAPSYESFEAALNPLNGRFPGGQTWVSMALAFIHLLGGEFELVVS
jgi:hypothetical protein